MPHQPLVYSAVNKNLTLWQGVKVECTPWITNWMSLQEECRWWPTAPIAKISFQPLCKTNKNLKTQLWVEILLLRTHRQLLKRLLRVDKSLTHRSTSQKTSYKFWTSTGRVVSVRENSNKPRWPGSAWRSCVFSKNKRGKKRLSIDM